MKQEHALRNVRLYYLFSVLKEHLFWGPILITFIMRVSGMSLSDIYQMEAVCVLGMVVLQVPFGALADTIGRRYTIMAGLLFMFVEGILFSISTTPALIWTANMCWVVGYSLVAGADSAMLYDSLKYLGRENEFKLIEGKAQGWRLATAALTSLSVGYLAEIDIRLPVFVSAVVMGINCIIAVFFIEPPLIATKHPSWSEYWRLMASSIVYVLRHRQIKWVIGFSVLVSVIAKLWFFSYNPYFEVVNLPLRYYGLLFFLLNVVAAISSHSTDWLYRHLGELGSIVMITLVSSLPIIAMGIWVSQWAVLLALLQNFARGYNGPLLGYILNRYVDSSNRATIISIKATALFAGEFVGLQIFGVMVGLISLTTCLELLGLVSLALGFWSILSYRRIFRSAS